MEILASGTRTASFTGADITDGGYRGAIITVNVGNVSAGSLVVTVEGKDRVSAKYYTIIASAPFLSAATRQLRIYPGLTASTNLTVSDLLPETWRVTTTAASGTADYSIGASLFD